MKKIGIVGGVGWQSTTEYYSQLCNLAENRNVSRGGTDIPDYPEIAIESLDLAKAVSYIGNDEDDATWAAFDAYHRDALLRLTRSGAELAIIASNSGHHRFGQITSGVRIPVLNIFEVVAANCERLGVDEVVVLGTDLTMRTPKLHQAFAEHRVHVGRLESQSRREVVALIAAIHRGHLSGAKDRISMIVRHLAGNRHMAVCLACTELPLAFPEQKGHETFEHGGVLYINTTAMHAKAAFDRANA